MKSILYIISQELKERLSSWITLIFFLMLVFQGIWYTKGTFDYFVNEGVLMNAPSIFYRNFAGMGILMIIIIAITTGSVLYKDIQYKSAQWIYTLPINEKSFFVGRYLAAVLYLFIISLGYFVGMLIVPYSGIGEASRFGPTPWGQMFHGLVLFTLPNLLLYVALTFAALVFTKRALVGYLAVFGVVIFFLICQSAYDAGNENLIYILGDPGGYVAAQNYSEHQNIVEKNTAYFPLSGYILQNRLLWLGITILLFVLSYWKFSFKYFIANPQSASNTKDVEEAKSTFFQSIPKVSLVFSTAEFVKKLFNLARLEITNITRPAAFKIILASISFLLIGQNLSWNATYYLGPEVPLSSTMTFFRLQHGVMIIMIMMIWAGELFFKDKTVKIWQITDALPVPTWVSLLSKYIALIAISAILSFTFIVLGITCQIILGGIGLIDLVQYALDLLTYRWGFLNFVLYISLVFFVAGLTGNRFVTHIVSVGYFFFTIISYELELLNQVRFAYAIVPGIEDFSEVSSYGALSEAANWFFAMWLCLGAIFVLLGIQFWDRGIGHKWTQKIQFKGNQLAWMGKLSVSALFVAFISFQVYLAKACYNNGNYITDEKQEELDATYEKKYKYIENRHQPKYKQVDLKFHYFTKERKASYEAEMLWSNANYCDTLFLTFEKFISVKSLLLNGQELKSLSTDSEQGLVVYLVPETYRKDSIWKINLQAEKQYVGITQSEYQADLTYNGSFGDVKSFLPHIGYKSEIEILENRKRTENGLPRLTSRMAAITDSIALGQDAFATDAEWVKGSILISTDQGQVPVAPGTLLRRFAENGRNFALYQVAQPQPFNWYLASANYASKTISTCNKSVEMLYKKEHTFNLNLYEEALKQAIPFVQKQLGELKGNDLKIIEIHRWQDPFYVYANSIAISEKEGWVADTKGLKEKAYIYHTMASSIAKEYVLQNLALANVQGVDMFKIALPEAIGLLFIEKQLGKEAVDLLIKKKMDKYGKDKNNEPNQEPSLLYADGIDYLEANKGAVTLYNTIKKIGIEKLKSTLDKVQKPLVFANLVTEIEEENTFK
jgi:hypothetical protein